MSGDREADALTGAAYRAEIERLRAALRDVGIGNMSDVTALVERLNEVLTLHLPADDLNIETVARIRRMMIERREAADEIERLRTALRAVQDIIDAHPLPSQRLVSAVTIIEDALSGKEEE